MKSQLFRQVADTTKELAENAIGATAALTAAVAIAVGLKAIGPEEPPTDAPSALAKASEPPRKPADLTEYHLACSTDALTQMRHLANALAKRPQPNIDCSPGALNEVLNNHTGIYGIPSIYGMPKLSNTDEGSAAEPAKSKPPAPSASKPAGPS